MNNTNCRDRLWHGYSIQFWIDLILVSLTLALSESCRGIVIPTLTNFVTELGGSNGLFLSVVVAMFSVGRLIASLVFGYVGDIWSTRTQLFLSVLLGIIGNIMFVAADWIGGMPGRCVLLFSRIFTGFGTGVLAVARIHVSAKTLPSQRTAFMSLLGIVQFVGFSFTPSVGGLDVSSDAGEFRIRPWTYGTMVILIFDIVLAILVLALMNHDPPSGKRVSPSGAANPPTKITTTTKPVSSSSSSLSFLTTVDDGTSDLKTKLLSSSAVFDTSASSASSSSSSSSSSTSSTSTTTSANPFHSDREHASMYTKLSSSYPSSATPSSSTSTKKKVSFSADAQQRDLEDEVNSRVLLYAHTLRATPALGDGYLPPKHDEAADFIDQDDENDEEEEDDEEGEEEDRIQAELLVKSKLMASSSLSSSSSGVIVPSTPPVRLTRTSISTNSTSVIVGLPSHPLPPHLSHPRRPTASSRARAATRQTLALEPVNLVYPLLFCFLNTVGRGCLGVSETYEALLYFSVVQRDDSTWAGLWLTIFGAVGVVVFMSIPKLNKCMSDVVLLSIGLFAMVIGFAVTVTFGQSAIGFGQFAIGLIGIWSVGSPLVQTLVVSMLSKYLGARAQSKWMGAITAGGSIGRIVIPLVAGSFFAVDGLDGAWLFGAVIMFVSFVATICILVFYAKFHK